MNNKADFAPIRWSYKVTREIARRMDAFRGELTSHHPHFYPGSPAATPVSIQGTTHKIIVGGANGELTFTPSNITAEPRDTVIFELYVLLTAPPRRGR